VWVCLLHITSQGDLAVVVELFDLLPEPAQMLIAKIISKITNIVILMISDFFIDLILVILVFKIVI